MVRRLSTATDPPTCDAYVVGPVVAAAPLQQIPQRRPLAEPSHVATLQRLLRKSGFLRGSAFEVSGCVRTHFPVIPGKVDAFLWLVSWKGRCSSQCHCTHDRGFPGPLTS